MPVRLRSLSLVIGTILLTAIILTVSWATAQTQNTRTFAELRQAFEEVDEGPIMIVAHRGCWSAAPENSVAAIEACVHLGIAAVEIDVRLTRDRQPIVFHDSTLHRMTGQWGFVWEYTLADLRELSLFERDGSSSMLNHKRLPTYHKIATLQEVLEAARNQLLINLEIKSDPGAGYLDVLAVSKDVVTRLGMQDHVFWKIPPSGRSSNDRSAADELFNRSNLSGQTYVMPMLWESGRPFIRKLEDFAGDGLIGFELVASNIDYWPLENSRITGADKYRYMGIAVLPQWSAGLADDIALQNPDGAWGRLIDLGFDMIMTDRPEQLQAYLRLRAQRRSQ